MSWLRIDYLLWGVLGLVWGVGALFSRKTVHRESFAMRALYMGPLMVAVLLIFTHTGSVEVLELSLVPHDEAFQILGVGLTGLGIAFAIWARVELGRLWSGTITLKEGHQLVQTGPYGLARHPIYTGFLLALVGTTVVTGTVRATIGLGIALVGFLRKIWIEEGLMARQFSGEHEDYKRRVKKLIPFVW